MNTEEAMTKPLETYTGNEIDSIEIEGAIKVLQAVKILLKNGNYITMQAKMDISEHRIVPHIVAERGKWARMASN